LGSVLSLHQKVILLMLPAQTTKPPGLADPGALAEHIKTRTACLHALRQQLAQVVIGQSALIDRLLITLLAGGHALLEGPPGLAKTLVVKTLAQGLGATFSRIQFTPDLLPCDILGTQVYVPASGAFQTHLGPIVAHLVLADEINRAPAKVQSALLEAMEEGQVTLGDRSHPLPQPFCVLATQNPLEQAGTYPLPEAQLDRFLFKICLTYPSQEEERAIVTARGNVSPAPAAHAVAGVQDLLACRACMDAVYLDERVRNYIVDLVRQTRPGGPLKGYVAWGASPRASILLSLAAKGHALLRGRAYVTPQDVKSVATDVLQHRLVLTYEAQADQVTPQALIDQVLSSVPVP
jgi:MoxR-like ATPase